MFSKLGTFLLCVERPRVFFPGGKIPLHLGATNPPFCVQQGDKRPKKGVLIPKEQLGGPIITRPKRGGSQYMGRKRGRTLRERLHREKEGGDPNFERRGGLLQHTPRTQGGEALYRGEKTGGAHDICLRRARLHQQEPVGAPFCYI